MAAGWIQSELLRTSLNCFSGCGSSNIYILEIYRYNVFKNKFGKNKKKIAKG